MLSACKTKTPVDPVIETPVGQLELIHTYQLQVPEPSGLSFGPGKKTLLTVSDNTNQVYELDMEGKVLRTLSYTGKDLEGITYNSENNLIVIAEEADREITLLDYDTGKKIETYRIDIEIGAENSGLEGVSYNPNNKLYYIINETNPDLMVLWNPVDGNISQEKLKFASDYSGIFADAGHSVLWFVSDQSEKLFKCDYNTNVLIEFNLDRLKYEGVAVDNDLVYLVNDATAVLNIYKIKSD